MSAYIQGLKSLEIKLSELASKEAIHSCLEQACLTVETQAKKNCPVDTGQLRNSITYEIEGNTGYVGTNVYYAPYVHQGTGVWAVNGDGRKTKWSYQDAEGNWHSTIGQKPQPFLEDALTQTEEEIQNIFRKGIK